MTDEKILVTGFDPFLNHTINPTLDVVEELDGKIIGTYEVVGRILPVAFKESGEKIVELIEHIQPDAVLSLGLAAGRNHITPERLAVNWMEGPKDNQGNRMSGERITECGPDGIFSTLPVQEMVEALHKEGLPASISNSAGTYICNNVMYAILHDLKKQKKAMPAGFIHIPASHELAVEQPKLPSMSTSDIVHAIRVCIEQVK